MAPGELSAGFCPLRPSAILACCKMITETSSAHRQTRRSHQSCSAAARAGAPRRCSTCWPRACRPSLRAQRSDDVGDSPGLAEEPGHEESKAAHHTLSSCGRSTDDHVCATMTGTTGAVKHLRMTRCAACPPSTWRRSQTLRAAQPGPLNYVADHRRRPTAAGSAEDMHTQSVRGGCIRKPLFVSCRQLLRRRCRGQALTQHARGGKANYHAYFP